MLKDFYDRILTSVRASRFSADLEALGAHLRRRGHRQGALSGYMYGAAHLAACLDRGLIRLEGLTADRLQQFARGHIERCSCARPRAKGKNFVSVARHFFDVLNERHGLAPLTVPTPAETPVKKLLRRLDEHLRDECGLRTATRDRCIRELTSVLDELCGTGEVEVSRWTAQKIRECVVARTRCSLHAARTRGLALRSLFRFLALNGEPVGHLAMAVPVVSYTRLAGLPRGLSDEQLAQLRRSIVVTKAIGLRTRAIVECLVTLGLRAGEAAALRLKDIDWRVGTLRVNTSKVRRGDVMPLPQTVGRAVAAYLKRGRPSTADDHVFVRHYLPVGGRLNSHDVTSTVRRAFRRAGLSLPSMGAHVLRHTTASRLVRAGVSIKQIADLMRHRDIDTTRIYTKVDWPRLAEVALPWPTAVAL